MRLDDAQWGALLGFFFDATNPEKVFEKIGIKTSLVVTAGILEKKGILKIVIPRQECTSWGCRTEFNFIDLLSGKLYEDPGTLDGPQHLATSSGVGRIIGEIDSHNTIGAFFSTTTDQNQLARFGTYLVVGKINLTENSYQVVASQVIRGSRIRGSRIPLKAADCVDLDVKPSYTYHPKIWDFISYCGAASRSQPTNA